MKKYFNLGTGLTIHTSRENKQENSFEKNISLWEGVLVLKGQYTRAERTSKRIALKKYFTLGGCCGLERPIHTSTENKLHTYEQREQARE